jgi:hypothetical protein
MILFHGSTQIVEQPNLKYCRNNTDFGKGFYTTTSKEQAEQWCKILQKRIENSKKIVSIFEFDNRLLNDNSFIIRDFKGVSEEWLDFIFANRNGYVTQFFDIVLGPVANDSLYATLQVFEQGIITKEQAIERLKTHTLVNQISFHSTNVLENLEFIKSYEVKLGK